MSLENRLKVRIEELEADLQAQKAALQAIFWLCGFVEDGSDQVVTIFQDDATLTWHLKAGSREFWADSKSELLHKIVCEVQSPF